MRLDSAGDAKDRVGLNALLVRPDGFAACATDGAPHHQDVTQAALRWFGEPEPAS